MSETFENDMAGLVLALVMAKGAENITAADAAAVVYKARLIMLGRMGLSPAPLAAWQKEGDR